MKSHTKRFLAISGGYLKVSALAAGLTAASEGLAGHVCMLLGWLTWPYLFADCHVLGELGQVQASNVDELQIPGKKTGEVEHLRSRDP